LYALTKDFLSLGNLLINVVALRAPWCCENQNTAG
jgi:hypothetical protein